MLSELANIGFWGMGVIISSLALFAIGLPVQIYRNYKRKSVEGISKPLFLLYFAAYIIWLSYGTRIGELPIIIPNSVATATGVVLMWQFWIYRKK